MKSFKKYIKLQTIFKLLNSSELLLPKHLINYESKIKKRSNLSFTHLSSFKEKKKKKKNKRNEFNLLIDIPL